MGMVLHVVFAFLVLSWEPGRNVLEATAGTVRRLIDFANQGTGFVFGGLFPVDEKAGFVFALNVLPVIILLSTLISALYYLRVLQWVVDVLGTAFNKVLGTSKIESVYAASVIFLGQSEAPLIIKPWIPRLTRSELFATMVGGFAAIATPIGYSLMGIPLEYLFAASLLNAPGSLVVAKMLMPESEPTRAKVSVRGVRDTESRNLIDALITGAITGGRIALTIACLLLASTAFIVMVSTSLGGIGHILGYEGWSLEGFVGAIFAPLAWAIGVPWEEASLVGNVIGEKTIFNEFVGYSSLSGYMQELSPKTVLVSTFALAGFANLSSIAIQIGTYGTLCPERRGEVAGLGLRALGAGFLTNMLNAAVVGVVVVV